MTGAASVCNSCGAALRDSARFCPECGAAQGRPANCTACGVELIDGARFCDGCGKPTGEPPASVTGTALSTTARRVTSVLFGDLVGFTSLAESRDQEDVRDVQARYFEECRRIVGRYGGVVEKFIGDAVMAVWGVPTAHEDDAERAVRAGLEMVSAVAGIRDEVGVADLDMRIGIVTGEVAVTVGATQQGMVTGDAVNTASRVQSSAAPSQVWVDETTRLLTSSAITYVDVGSHVLKGKAEPVPLWAVRAVVAAVGGAQRADGLEAPLVGRDRELRLLKELFHRVEESGRQAVVLISGEPGMGKSRLRWEFEKYVDGLSTTARWNSGRCVSYGEGVAYYALAEAVRGRLESGRTDEQQSFTDRLDEAMTEYFRDPEERGWVRPRIDVLLGLAASDGYDREDLFAAWTAFLRALAGDGDPVILVIEDAHHADEGMIAFLEQLTSSAPFPCFVVLLARPEILDKYPALATNRRLTVLHLEGLSSDDIAAVLDGLVDGLPVETREALVERAEGVPLYAVELVRSLIDRDLVLPRGGQYVLVDPGTVAPEMLTPPTSLQTLVSARLDALTAEQRFVVSRASVLGTSFSREALAGLCSDVDLDAAISSLVRLQIFRQEESRLSVERGQMVFVQSVVRQVAYGILSRRDRRAVHLAVAAQLEATETAADAAAIIAEHYLEAVRAAPRDPGNTALVTAAVAQLRHAAERARTLGAPAEAAAHLQVALDLVHSLEDFDDEGLVAELERDLARAASDAGRHDDAVIHGTRAMTAFDARGDELNLALAAEPVARAYQARGEILRSLELLRPLYLSLLERDGAERALLALSRPYTFSLQRTPVGPHRAPMELEAALQRELAWAERSGADHLVAQAWVGFAIHIMEIGAARLSQAVLEAAVGVARDAHDLRSLTSGLHNLNAHYNAEDITRAVDLGRESQSVSRAYGAQFSREMATANLLLALLCQGAWTEMDELLEANSDSVTDTNQLVAHARWWQCFARGRTYQHPWERQPSEALQDPQFLYWTRITEALVTVSAGETEAALEAALEAVRVALDFSGVGDDFFLIWLSAVHVAEQSDSAPSLRTLLAMVDDIPDPLLSRSLRAGRHHVSALVGAVDGEDATTVDGHFREAVLHAEAWGAPLFAARFRADHARWLLSRGRQDEARHALDLVREFYVHSGSTGWLAQLDEATGGFASPPTGSRDDHANLGRPRPATDPSSPAQTRLSPMR